MCGDSKQQQQQQQQQQQLIIILTNPIRGRAIEREIWRPREVAPQINPS